MDIEFIGGIAKSATPKKVLERKVQRFLETQPVIETKTLLIDVNNLFNRKFMCCKENCDFYAHHNKSSKSKGLFDVGNTVEWVDKGCCEGGSLEIPQELIKNIDEHISGIKKFMDPECADYIEQRGWSRKLGKGLIGVKPLPKDDRCVFTFMSEGMNYCALHAYALAKDIPLLELKPFECFIFPLDFIKIDDKILVTAISNMGDTGGILRWGDNHMGQSCMHKTEGGEPMYLYAKDVIVEVLGDKKWNAIDKIYKRGDWKDSITK